MPTLGAATIRGVAGIGDEMAHGRRFSKKTGCDGIEDPAHGVGKISFERLPDGGSAILKAREQGIE